MKHFFTDLNDLGLLGEPGVDPPDPPGPDPEEYQGVQPDHADRGHCDGGYQGVNHLKLNMFPINFKCSTSPEKSSENTNSVVRIPIVDPKRWQRLSGNKSNLGLTYYTMCTVIF